MTSLFYNKSYKIKEIKLRGMNKNYLLKQLGFNKLSKINSKNYNKFRLKNFFLLKVILIKKVINFYF